MGIPIPVAKPAPPPPTAQYAPPPPPGTFSNRFGEESPRGQGFPGAEFLQQFGQLAGQVGSKSGAALGQLGGALGNAGAGAGAGAAAGGGAAGMLAAAAPPVAIAMAAKKLKESLEEGARATVQSLGQVATKVAQLDTTVFAEGFEKAADQAGIVGVALAETSRQFRAFDGALAELSKRFAKYSGPLAQAEAMGDVGQILGDLRRAKRLEDAGMAQLTNARNKASQAAQDLLVSLLIPVIPAVTKLMENIASGVDRTAKTVEVGAGIFPTYMEMVKASFSLDIREVARLQAKMFEEARRIREGLEKKDTEKEGDVIGMLLGYDAPITVGAAPPEFPAPRPR